MEGRDFAVRTKAQLEKSLSQGVYDASKGRIEEDFTSTVISHCMHEIMKELPYKGANGEPHKGIHPPLNKTAILSKTAKDDMKMSNMDTRKRYTGYVKGLYDYIDNEEDGRGSPTNEVTLCNFFSFLKHTRFNAGSLWTVYSAINNHYQN